jgi:hypothetical protein
MENGNYVWVCPTFASSSSCVEQQCCVVCVVRHVSLKCKIVQFDLCHVACQF